MSSQARFPIAALVTTLALASGASVFAQDFPARPVRIVTGNPGATADLLTRYLAKQLTERWGRQVIVENRGGGGGVISAEYTARALPDGYTLHMAQLASLAAAPSLHQKLSYDPLKDLAPVTLFAQTPLLIVVHPSMPVRTLRELIDLAKQRPEALSYASAGPGTGSHLTTALVNHVAGIRMVNISYRGTGAAITAIISGETHVSSLSLPSGLPQVRAGKVRALAITSKKRFSGVPDIPTADEAGLRGFESTAWFGIVVPGSTPAERIARLNRDIVGVLDAPATQVWIVARGADPSPGTPEEFAAFIKSEIEKWGPVLKGAGIQAH
jgi:tripartite-type tricarboxylate transporter receptor subunit TctC